MAKPELRDHRKFLKLKRLLGEPTPHVLGYLECLWHRGYQIGSAFIGDALDVEAAAEYPGEPGRFAKAAHESGFIDTDDQGRYLIHDLYDHAPKYAQMRMRRKGTAPARSLPDDAGSVTDVTDHGTFDPDPEKISNERGTEGKTQNPEPKAENQEQAEDSARPAPKRFVAPTLDEVRAYAATLRTMIDPEAFVDYYQSNGWRVGRNPMRDWKAAVRTWAKNERRRHPAQRSPPDRGTTYIRQSFEASKVPPESPHE